MLIMHRRIVPAFSEIQMTRKFDPVHEMRIKTCGTKSYHHFVNFFFTLFDEELPMDLNNM